MSVMDTFCNDMFNTLASEAAGLCRANGGKTLTTKCMTSAVALTLPGGLAGHAATEVNKACMKFAR